MRKVATAFTALALAAVFFGCTSPGGPTEPEPEYRLRTSPENTIHNIRESYVWMNADEYLDCLSEDFIFFPAEDDVGGSIPEEWYKSDERMVHENMFDEDGNVDSVTLQLTNVSIEVLPGADPSDPMDDIHVYEEAVDLRIHLLSDLSYHASTPSVFHIRVDQDQVGPHGEVLYEVFGWYDAGPPTLTAGGGRAEDATWGSIKSLYR